MYLSPEYTSLNRLKVCCSTNLLFGKTVLEALSKFLNSLSSSFKNFSSSLDGIELEGLEFFGLDFYKKSWESSIKRVTDPYNKAKVKAEFMIRIKNEINQRAEENKYTRENKIFYPDALIYFDAFYKAYGGYTDLEDATVLTEGRTINGEEAGVLDYSLAGVGAFIPFVSGGAFKQLFKNVTEGTIEHAVKHGDELVNLGKSTLDENGVLEMFFNVPEEFLGNGFGKDMLEESFETFGDKIKKVDVTWGMDDAYPGNMSKGLRDAWNYYDSMPNPSAESAVRASGLYSLLEAKGFKNIEVHSFERDMIEVTFER